MITVHLSTQPLTDQQHASVALLLPQDFEFGAELKELQNAYCPALPAYIKQERFKGGAGSIVTVNGIKHDTPCWILLAGVGKPDSSSQAIERARRAIGSLVKTLQNKKLSECAIRLPKATLFKVDTAYLVREIAICAAMAAYRFDDFITDDENKVNKALKLTFVVDPEDLDAAQKGLNEGMCIAQAVNQTRHWIDLPGGHIYPAIIADHARDIAQKYGLGCTIFDKKKLAEEGMGGILGVSAGSQHDPRLVIMEYTPAAKNVPTLVFVGKGITFDSGGLSLKPAQSMEAMKDDMSGAAAVINTMQVLAQLKPNVRVIGVAPLAENMPSGTAIRPGDILRFYNGKTAEIKNTDAEGRLVLADALSYAVKNYKPDAIIDLATLTGACAYALGSFFSGLLSQHDELTQRVQKAAEVAGERVWRLPMDNDFKKAIKCDVADMCNSGNARYKAGTITAAFFLQHFVGDVPWVHLDIAGTAFDVPDISYYSTGGTGVGVRLLTELAMHWQ
jgi:leucyl aminopeptidase